MNIIAIINVINISNEFYNTPTYQGNVSVIEELRKLASILDKHIKYESGNEKIEEIAIELLTTFERVSCSYNDVEFNYKISWSVYHVMSGLKSLKGFNKKILEDYVGFSKKIFECYLNGKINNDFYYSLKLYLYLEKIGLVRSDNRTLVMPGLDGLKSKPQRAIEYSLEELDRFYSENAFNISLFLINPTDQCNFKRYIGFNGTVNIYSFVWKNPLDCNVDGTSISFEDLIVLGNSIYEISAVDVTPDDRGD